MDSQEWPLPSLRDTNLTNSGGRGEHARATAHLAAVAPYLMMMMTMAAQGVLHSLKIVKTSVGQKI